VGPVHYRLHSAPHFAKFTHPHADHARDSLTSGATRKWATLLPSLDLTLDLREAEAHPSVDDYGPQSNSELGPLSIAVAAATHALHCACLREMEVKCSWRTTLSPLLLSQSLPLRCYIPVEPGDPLPPRPSRAPRSAEPIPPFVLPWSPSPRG
jgi:hypothetical protein